MWDWLILLVFGLVKYEFFVDWEVESFLFEGLEDFGAEVEIMDHAMVVWAEAD